MVWSKRCLPPPRRTSTRWATVCSAMEPGPPAARVSVGHRSMSAGPWQLRSVTCEVRAAGVASVSSALVTLPVASPPCRASSRIVGTARSVSAVLEIRSFTVLWPVAQAVAPAAESVT
ncbi:hypothetical protein SCALM49S_00302 [Streptomyces californicus]